MTTSLSREAQHLWMDKLTVANRLMDQKIKIDARWYRESLRKISLIALQADGQTKKIIENLGS